MDAREAMRTTSLGEFREPVREVAERSATHDGNQAKGGDSDAGACAQAVEQKNQPDDRCGRDGE
jgi:hypothetical protein